MASWEEFARADPELAERVRARIEEYELILLGSLKADGSPRISPVEPDFVDGELMLGMMPMSTKALDLRRDPRCVVHTIVTDRNGTEGEYKINGTAREINDPATKERYGDVIEQRLGWRPTEPFHVFAIDIDRVWGFIYDETGRQTWRWPHA